MELNRLIASLSPNERKILPFLEERVIDICKKANLDKTSVMRALTYLENKGVVRVTFAKTNRVELGVNGALYKKKGLPERRLLYYLAEQRILPLREARKQAGLSEDELKASIGVLKKKAMIELKNGKILLSASKEELIKKSPEELLLESLPLDSATLTPEQRYALANLEKRKNLVFFKEEKTPTITLTPLGKKVIQENISEEDLIETLTPALLKKESLWKRKKFRRYDVSSRVPLVYGGKHHFVHQALDYVRRVWTDMGFKEMSGPFVQSSFWNFDALFTAQDHPVRDMQDTFFLDAASPLPREELVHAVKQAHESGVSQSKGWKYSWDEATAKKLVLRTHTTCLSAQTLANLNLKSLPAKFFSLGKCFRNETVDWSHGFEFYQTEGIVVDEHATFRDLLGYLKLFYKKMGFEKIRFTPAYFPYTEPSVEVNVWHPEKKVWLELGGAGMFRPEVTAPLFGKPIPVLAWGQGFDRIIMDYYKIKDLRELYKNNLKTLRTMKFWTKT